LNDARLPRFTSSRSLSRRRTLGLVAGSLASLALHPLVALGQADAAADYPNKPIHLYVPFPPGTGTDTGARYFGKKIQDLTGQPVIVENRAGANGFLAVKAVTSAAPDGYSLLFGSNSTLATNVALFKKLPYDPVKDLAPISTMMRSPIVLIVPANSPYRTLAEFVAAAKGKSVPMSYGSGSAGYQLMGELFAERAGIKLLNVPYKGAAEVALATVSGQTDLGVADVTASIELMKSGRIRALALGSEQRMPGLPDLPTAIEAGIAGFTAETWTGAAAPARTPQAIVDKLSSMFVQILAMPETKAFYEPQNVFVMKGGQEELRRFQAEQIEVWKRVATTAKVELQ
jgi:tripartite-type tricarboxylate transporter receptor subunit TctC